MYRSSPFQLPELAHKDNVISTLKKELSELRDVEADFYKVDDQIAKLENKYTLLADEKNQKQKDHKLRIDLGKKAISQLKSDIDKLRVQIHKASSQIQDNLRQNNTLRRIVDNRNDEIDGLIHRNSELQSRNQLQQAQNRDIAQNIKQLKIQRSKISDQCERINSLLDGIVSAIKTTEKQVRTLQVTSAKLDSNIAEAQKDNLDLLTQLKSKEANIVKNEQVLQSLQNKTQSMLSKNKQLQSNQKRLDNEIETANSNLSNEILKHKDQVSKLKNLENTIRANEDELQSAINKKQGLKQQHFELVADNKQLNGDIDNCLLNILQFEKLNEQLQRQIQNYIDTDEEARKILDRKNVMKSLLDQVNTKLEKTSEQIAHLR